MSYAQNGWDVHETTVFQLHYKPNVTDDQYCRSQALFVPSIDIEAQGHQQWLRIMSGEQCHDMIRIMCHTMVSPWPYKPIIILSSAEPGLQQIWYSPEILLMGVKALICRTLSRIQYRWTCVFVAKLLWMGKIPLRKPCHAAWWWMGFFEHAKPCHRKFPSLKNLVMRYVHRWIGGGWFNSRPEAELSIRMKE